MSIYALHVAILRWAQRRVARKFPPEVAQPRIAALERIIETLGRGRR